MSFVHGKYSLALKLAVSAVLIWLVMRNSSFVSIYYFFGKYSWPTVGLVIVLLALALVIAALRWKLLVPDIGFLKILKFTIIGQFYSLILPGQITGEAAKAYRLSSEQSGSGGRISASVAVDKVVGLIGLLILAIVGLLLAPVPARGPLSIAAIAALCALLFVLFVLARSRLQSFVLNLLAKGKERFPLLARPADFLSSAAGHYGSFSRKGRVLAASLILAIAYQVVAVLITHVLALALGIDIGLVQWFSIFGVISFAVVLPITVAGLGVREGLFAYFLAGLGVSHEAAIALSLSVLATQCLMAVAGGLIELKEQI